MNRLRLAFAVVTVSLLVPVALLVHHALEKLESDRIGRHRAVAERLFDEMERELTAWLRLEEDRPFGHYRFLYLPEIGLSPRLERSPLADGPREPFVLAHFQVDPDGTVSSPLWPVDADRAARALGWRMEDSQESHRDGILGLLADLVVPRASGRGGAPEQAASSPERLAAGARNRESVAAAPRGASETKAPTIADAGRPPALERFGADPETDLLSLLNRGLQSREGRTTRVQQSQAINVLDFTQDGELERQPRKTDRADPGSPSRRRAGADAGPGSDLFTFPAAADFVAVSLEPMVGRPLESNGLLLYRTVVIEDRAYRQGMVVDGPALVEWLAGRVLGELEPRSQLASALGSRASDPYDPPTHALQAEGAEVSWGASERTLPVGETAMPATEGDPGLEFRHRFAEPFGSVAARVRLDPLPPLPTTFYVYFLAALLGLAATLGLYALYRTVAVQMAFAERRSNFVSSVTHELKTPLTAIRMYGEMLRDGVVPDDDRRKDYYRILTAEAERLSRLIHNVLELSRLEKQTRRFDLQAGDPRQVMAEVAEVLGPHADQNGFVLCLHDEGPSEALYDKDALAQVLFNLVDNAIKYATDAEDRRVELRCAADGERIRLSVADRGPGVARKNLKTVFEPFFRGESELTRRTKGTGIGLSLVQSLVAQMGGTVRGRNREGGGFEVVVHLEAIRS